MLVSALLTLNGAAQAAGAEDTDWSFSYSGFGTLGAVYHTAADVEFRRDISQKSGVKAHELGFSPDTILGVQGSATFRKTVEASLQLTSRLNTEGSYNPEIALAFVKYRPSDDFALRVGRLGIEMYVMGDSVEIGYANLPTRQPMTFYPRVFDGGDVEGTLPLAGGLLRAKAFGGWAAGKFLAGTATYDTHGSLIRGALVEYGWDAWSARLSSGALSLKDPITDPLTVSFISALRAFMPNGNQIADRLAIQHRTIDYVSGAVSYDSAGMQGTVSYSKDFSQGWPSREVFYGNVAHPMGAWTPYLTYSVQRTRRSILSTGMPDGVFPVFDTLNLASGIAQGAAIYNQSDLGLGIRYEITRSAALKFQLNRILYQDPESIIDATRDYVRFQDRHFKPLTLWSAALDFVF